MSDILCVTNRRLCKENFLMRVKKMAANHPAGIILREKDLSPQEYGLLAKEVLYICRQQHVLCVLHSFTETAYDLGAEAIHLPLPLLQEMTEKEKKHFHIIGASCHSLEDALEAEKLGCTYITAGHIFATDCKTGLPGRGLDFLKIICQKTSVPVYAIGGVTSQNIRSVQAAGAKGACIMSGPMKCSDVASYMKNFEKAGNN